MFDKDEAFAAHGTYHETWAFIKEGGTLSRAAQQFGHRIARTVCSWKPPAETADPLANRDIHKRPN